MNEGEADDGVGEVDDSQTGVYDNIENVQQQLTRQRCRTRREHYLNHVAAAGAVHVEAGGGASAPAVSDGSAAAGADRTETAAFDSILTDDVDRWTTSVRRRGRCADRRPSNRVVGPSFVSSTRVQLGDNRGCELQQQQQLSQQPSQQQQQHSEQFLSSDDAVELSSTATSVTNQATSTTIGEDSTQAGNESKTDPPWNGYDNITELKEAIFSSAAAKVAAGSKTKSGGLAALTTVPSGGRSSADEGLLSGVVPPPTSSRAIGERVVDVHRQRLSAAGRQLTAPDDGIQTSASSTTTKEVVESSVTVVVSSATSPETEAAPTLSADITPPHDQKVNSDAAPACVGGSNIAYSDNAVRNVSSQQTKKTDSFEKEDADPAETKVVASKGRKQKNKNKPPIGKTGSDSSTKAEKKSELRKEKKEHKSAAGSEAVSEQEDHVVGKTEQPVSKMSFLKSLLTRSRSPSPKRGSNNSNDRSASPLSLGRDVAKRLSDPLKASFKQTSDAPVVKVTVKQRDKKKKQPLVDVKKRSEQTSVPDDSSTSKGMVDSSDVHVEETLAISSNEEVKSPMAPTPDDRSETSPSSKTENLSAATSSCTKQPEIANTSPDFVPCQSTEAAIVVTTAMSELPTSGTAGIVSSASDVVEQSPERRRSATVITLRSAANSSGSEAATMNRFSASQTAATLPPSNPWLVNLREFRIRPNLDTFEGEKVFKKGTVTTRLVLPGFARSQQDFMTSCDGGEPRSGTLQRLTTTSTTRKMPSELRDRHSAVASPIYDAVYVERPSPVYKSTTELLTNSHQSSAAQPADDIGKSYSLQDLKQQTGARQTSTVSGDAATAGRIRTLTTMEHAIDDDELRNYTGHIGRGRRDCAIVPTTTASKQVKTVTFRDDVDANCSYAEQRLESVQGLRKTETSMDGRATAVLSPPASHTHPPPVTGVDRCVKTTKSASLPACGQPVVHSSSVDVRHNVSALRDTITSCDLEELPKYLADMYRQQKLERQREQELAARDRERLENIEKMWKDLENQLTTPASVATASTNSAKAEPTEDYVPDINHLNTQTIWRKPTRQQQVFA